MKPKIEMTIGDSSKGEYHKLVFESVEEIDFVMEHLQEARAELEHQIEMERMREKEKKNRRKRRRYNVNDIKDVEENIRLAEEELEHVPEFIKPICIYILDMAKELVKEEKKKDNQ